MHAFLKFFKIFQDNIRLIKHAKLYNVPTYPSPSFPCVHALLNLILTKSYGEVLIAPFYTPVLFLITHSCLWRCNSQIPGWLLIRHFPLILSCLLLYMTSPPYNSQTPLPWTGSVFLPSSSFPHGKSNKQGKAAQQSRRIPCIGAAEFPLIEGVRVVLKLEVCIPGFSIRIIEKRVSIRRRKGESNMSQAKELFSGHLTISTKYRCLCLSGVIPNQ